MFVCFFFVPIHIKHSFYRRTSNCVFTEGREISCLHITIWLPSPRPHYKHLRHPSEVYLNSQAIHANKTPAAKEFGGRKVWDCLLVPYFLYWVENISFHVLIQYSEICLSLCVFFQFCTLGTWFHNFTVSQSCQGALEVIEYNRPTSVWHHCTTYSERVIIWPWSETLFWRIHSFMKQPSTFLGSFNCQFIGLLGQN